MQPLRLQDRTARLAASMCSGVSMTGTMAMGLSAMATLQGRGDAARMAWQARPWASRAWWTTCQASRGRSRARPGACGPGAFTPWPSRAKLAISLRVIQWLTRSPRRLTTSEANSPKSSTTSRPCQPR